MTRQCDDTVIHERDDYRQQLDLIAALADEWDNHADPVASLKKIFRLADGACERWEWECPACDEHVELEKWVNALNEYLDDAGMISRGDQSHQVERLGDPKEVVDRLKKIEEINQSQMAWLEGKIDKLENPLEEEKTSFTISTNVPEDAETLYMHVECQDCKKKDARILTKKEELSKVEKESRSYHSFLLEIARALDFMPGGYSIASFEDIVPRIKKLQKAWGDRGRELDEKERRLRNVRNRIEKLIEALAPFDDYDAHNSMTEELRRIIAIGFESSHPSGDSSDGVAHTGVNDICECHGVKECPNKQDMEYPVIPPIEKIKELSDLAGQMMENGDSIAAVDALAGKVNRLVREVNKINLGKK
jgi:DNA repair exonuclease SbcCD ATPase subunit